MSQPFFQHLDTVGDGSGDDTGIADYSVTPRVLRIDPPAGWIYEISNLHGYIADAAAFTPTGYGNLATLTNGISIAVYEGESVLIDLTGNDPIKSNSHWAMHGDSALLLTWGGGANTLTGIWNFINVGAPLTLHGDSNHSLRVTLNDNFTGLDAHHFLVHGVKIRP